MQAIAPWFTLPDLVAGGRSVVRELAEAGEKTTEVLSRARTLGSRSASARTEARQVLADPEQEWRQIKAARDEAARRANDYRRMHALAQRESLNLLARRNAVLATVGGAYAARQYVHEPPVLTEHAYDKLKEKAGELGSDIYSHAEKALSAAAGSACRPGSVGFLLTPSGPPRSSNIHLNMSVIVTHHQARGR